MLVLVLILCVLGHRVDGRNTYFDSYSRKELSDDEVKNYTKEGILDKCTNRVRLPCDPEDFRRLDGSCNNLKQPSYGTVRTPYLRLLTPVFGPDQRDRESENGGTLPLVRFLRTKLLDEGSVPNNNLTLLAMYYLRFSFLDSGNMQDALNYILYKTDCCEASGKGDYMCTPHEIPEYDPVHRFTGVRCMNQTRPITFQTYGCLQNGTTTPARTNTATPLLDLSQVYQFDGLRPDRLYERGELILDTINEKIWPKNGSNVCIANQLPEENLCFKRTSNLILGAKFTAVHMFRLHNYIAQQLAAINPCWDDYMLFFTARDINIAISTQILMYELMPELLGRENLINKGIILRGQGFRPTYHQNILPQVSEEYIYVLRYFHTAQESKLQFSNSSDGRKIFPITNSTLRTGYFVTGNHFEQITQSSFKQACAAFDHTVDPSIAEVGLGNLQYASDITMNDLAKGRTIGFPGYVKYRQFCSDKTYSDFDDLSNVMDEERIDILRDLYKTVGDVDMMAGIWSERIMPGTRVPYTVNCLMTDQLMRFIESDRFWYESKNRPHAFTARQFAEIRKSTIAGILCRVGNGVTQIQKRAFLQITNRNPLVNCSAIPFINFAAWKDESCES